MPVCAMPTDSSIDAVHPIVLIARLTALNGIGVLVSTVGLGLAAMVSMTPMPVRRLCVGTERQGWRTPQPWPGLSRGCGRGGKQDDVSVRSPLGCRGRLSMPIARGFQGRSTPKPLPPDCAGCNYLALLPVSAAKDWRLRYREARRPELGGFCIRNGWIILPICSDCVSFGRQF